MDADLYQESIEYEKLTQAVYQAILNEEGFANVDVEHNRKVRGRSGVKHQIDVLWTFRQAAIRHAVMIECKNYSSAITLEKVRNFFAVLHDVGNVKGVMVTKIGYQAGAEEFANFYGIDLKLLRKPTEDDWSGRVKDIRFNIVAKAPVSTSSRPIVAQLYLRPQDSAQEARLNTLQSVGQLNPQIGANQQFLDKNGVPCTEELKWWLPKELDVLKKEPGGPYKQDIKLEGKYVLVGAPDAAQELVEAIGMQVSYWVESLETRQFEIHGMEVVQAILKDYATGTVEHVHRT